MPLFDHHIGLPIFVFKNSEAVNHGTINQPLQLLAGCDMTLHFTHNAIRTMTTSLVYTRLSSRIRTKFEMPLLAFGDTVKQCIVVLGFPLCMHGPPRLLNDMCKIRLLRAYHNICNKIYELILSTHPRFRIQSNIGFPIFLFVNFTFVWWGAMMPSNHAGILTCSFSLPTSDSQEISLKNDLSCDGMCGMIGTSQASYHRQSGPFGFPSETSRFRTESNGFCLEYRRGFAYVMYACHENHEFSSKNLIVSKVSNYYRFRALRNPRIPYF